MKEETKQGRTREVPPKKAYTKPELTKHESLRVVQGLTCIPPFDGCTSGTG